MAGHWRFEPWFLLQGGCMQLAQGLWHSLKRQGAAEATDLIPPLLQGFSVGMYRKDFQQLWRKSDFLYNSVLTDHELEVLCFPLKDDFSQRLEMTLLQILTEGLVPPHLLNLLHTASTRVKGVGAECSSLPISGFYLSTSRPAKAFPASHCPALLSFHHFPLGLAAAQATHSCFLPGH